MIDPNLLRQSPDVVRRGLQNRGGRFIPAFEELVKCDEERRKLTKEFETLQASRNALSEKIGKAKAAKDAAESERLMKEVGLVKQNLEARTGALAEAEEKARKTALDIPNLPHESVPVGKSEADNRVVSKTGEPTSFDFKPFDHQTIGEKLGLIDFSAAAKISGARFCLWRGLGARMMRALVDEMLSLHRKAGYEEVAPPYLVRPEILEGTGQLPKFEADLYKTLPGGEESSKENGKALYLIPTAEVPLTNLVRDEIADAAKLPMKFMAYTPCFRQEAGSYGKDVRGLIRNHQFDKVELVWITKSEDSLAALEILRTDAEAVLKAFEIPYRVIELCTGDLGFASRKTYDLEVWMPSEARYREISSCSDCGDFQARRMSARMRRETKGKPEFVHTLNGSGVAVGRLFAAILENFQKKDGSLKVPHRLAASLGVERIAPR